MKLYFTWDDGAPEDVRLFELHEKYQIPGMFFVPTRNREGRKVITPQIMRAYESEYIRFGGHTENHTYLTDIPLDMVDAEVRNNKEYLEQELGHPVNDFCLPGGKYNESVIKIASQYYDTIRTADIMNFRNTGNLIKPTFHLYPRGYKSLIGNSIRNHSWKELLYLISNPGKSDFQYMEELIKKSEKQDDYTIIIWGHSWEIEEHDLWRTLEELFDKMIYVLRPVYDNC